MAMEIEFVAFGPFRDIVGRKSTSREFPDGTTVGSALGELASGFPEMESRLFEDGELSTWVTITINGTNVRQLDGRETTLEDGDVLRITPPVRGG